MSTKTVQYGPFSPQELESMVGELQRKNIPFDLSKDEAAEGEFKRVDYANIVVQTQFRTAQYMAQIFYLNLAKSDVPKVAAQLERLGFPTNLPEESAGIASELEADSKDDIFIKAALEKNSFTRRQHAWVLVVGILCLMFLAYAIQS